ncbi:MAG TPA: sodium-translocating pyrophosphatase, partial [Acidimicrobiales bacterium]|nr:sodium-translocating pyrophosphatase [Acidimicrobiales bacterium]
KVEAGIPEDDPRNPATIADNVGDNVGDVAGMGADLFESYAGSIIAPIALAAFIPLILPGDSPEFFLFPLAIAAVGMVASIIGAFTVKASDSASVKDLSRALHRGTNVAAAITVVAVVVLSYVMFADSAIGGGLEVDAWWGLSVAVIGGLVVGYAIGKVAEIWTSDHVGPVKKIAAQAETGPATVVLGGVSAGMMSVAASVILIGAGIGVAYWGGEQTFEGLGVYGIAVAAIGMLATTGVVVSVDAYGPIADNAGGIAEMAHLDPSVREVTDALDSLGNTTAAVAKGFAVGSAALTALALFKSFEASLAVEGHLLNLDIGQVEVFIGLLFGVMLPFLFASLTIDAVGRAANKMIEEVRRQFREIPGLREGVPGVVPEYARCVDISTSAALREMLLPGALAVAVPLGIGFVDVDALGGFLGGALASGFALAIFMANSGGAWDNAKKYIEAGHHGGKGSEPHKAAVVGDTVGDPFKDTSGPSMNILIKVMTIVSLIFASAFV